MLLGIDTGGTYTDAVLVTDGPDAEVIASAKAPTTHHDLAIGIAEAIDSVLGDNTVLGDGTGHGSVAPDSIGLCSMSTTLATNAIVEGRGGRVVVIGIGFTADELARSAVDEESGDVVVIVDGGHDAQGQERSPLDLDGLRNVLGERLASVGDRVAGFAVVAHFAVRNPDHELAARAMLEATFDHPVTCSHELTSKLGGPRRALTCVLNARLIGVIGSLLDATDRLLTERGINAPRMVVRGDGSLVSLAFARARPIETILSGPAASLVGAHHLTTIDDAIVADVGGTTTDVAVLTQGRPRLDVDGAVVGGHRTMVEAVAIATVGLGGDSRITIDDRIDPPAVVLGPERVIPVAMFAADHPELVRETLERQLARREPRPLDGGFATLRTVTEPVAGNGLGSELLAQLSNGPVALAELLPTRRHELAFDALVRDGSAIRVGPTPTDSAHVLGLDKRHDADVAVRAVRLLARQRDRGGLPIAQDETALAHRVLDQLAAASARRVVATALDADGLDGSTLAAHPLLARALDAETAPGPHLRLSGSVGVPLIALGASAATHYPAVAGRVNASLVLPPHGDVANAVGAVVGQVTMRATVVLTPRKDGGVRAHVSTGSIDDDTLEGAADRAIEEMQRLVTASCVEQGVLDATVDVVRNDTTAEVGGAEMLVESTITVSASGRPQFATAGRGPLASGHGSTPRTQD